MATKLRVIDFKDDLVEEAEVEAGISLAQAVVESFPDGFGDVVVFIMDPRQQVIETNDVALTVTEDDQTYTLALRPKDPITTFLAGSALFGLTTVGGLIVAGLALAAAFLIRPKLPEITPQESYNWDNSDDPQFFSAQSNRLRIGARLPDLFGRMRIWPDLIVEPHSTYSGGEQETQELYVISNGDCIVEDAFIHEEETSRIPNTEYTVIRPGNGQTWPTQSQMPIYQSNNYVANIGLAGPNNATALSVSFQFSTSGWIEADVAGYFTPFRNMIGKWVEIKDTPGTNNGIYYINNITNGNQRLVVTPNPSQNRSGVYARLQGITKAATTNGKTLRQYHSYDGAWANYYMPDLSNPFAQDNWKLKYRGSKIVNHETNPGFTSGHLVKTDLSIRTQASYQHLVGPTNPLGGSFHQQDGFNIFKRVNQNPAGPLYFVQYVNGQYQPNIPGTGFTTALFTIPGVINRIEADFEFPQGLYQEKAGEGPAQRNVTVKMYYRLADSGDPYQTHSWTMGADVRSVRRFTKGINVPQGEYECYFQRTTTEVNSSGDFVAIDTTQLIALRGRQVFTAELLADEINCTLILLNLRSTNMLQLAQTRSFSVVATRVLPDNSHDGDLLRATPYSIEQSILYSLINQAGYDPNLIDRQGLAAIQTDLNAMGSSKASEFHAILDQTNTVEDQIRTMAGPGRIIIYRRGGKIYFSRVKANMIPTRMISNRSKVEPEQRNLNFGDSNDATSVILRYMDRGDSYREKEVQWPNPADTPGAEINPEEQSVLGITDTYTAMQAAQYIWDKRKYERDTITIPMHDDGILLSPGEVIAVTDALEPNSVFLDGQIKDIIGTVWDFDRIVPAGTYVLRIVGADGEMYHTDANLVVASPTITIDLGVAAPANMPPAGASVGLRWSLVETNDEEWGLFWVKDVSPSREGAVTVEGTVYRQETFESDHNVQPSSTTAAQKQGFNG